MVCVVTISYWEKGSTYQMLKKISMEELLSLDINCATVTPHL